MALTAQSLIDEAVAVAYPFVRDEGYSPVALLKHLSTLDREIVGQYMIYAPERLSAAGTDITVVAATNATGYGLTAAKIYLNFTYLDQDGFEMPIEITPDGKLPSRHPAGVIRGNTFFPHDPALKRWVGTDLRSVFRGDGDKIAYRYIAEPALITAMSATLASPDEARSYIISALTLLLLLMQGGAAQERLQTANEMMMAHKLNLLLEINKRTGRSARYGE